MRREREEKRDGDRGVGGECMQWCSTCDERERERKSVTDEIYTEARGDRGRDKGTIETSKKQRIGEERDKLEEEKYERNPKTYAQYSIIRSRFFVIVLAFLKFSICNIYVAFFSSLC
jgi:hypothetical protein